MFITNHALAGATLGLLGVIFGIRNAAVSVVAVPFAIFIYLLELFVAFLQAYIFTILTASYIGGAIAEEH